jgi:hypothetical protein
MVEDRIRAALREIVTAPPAPVNEKRHRWTSAMVAATAVAAILAAVLLPPAWSADRPPVGSGGQPTLPGWFPAYSWLQGSVDGPFGRAMALYTNGTGHEDFGFWQVIVAGADRNSLRKLDLPERSPSGGPVDARLSPDGTKVLTGGRPGIITAIDLVTGASKHYPVPDDLPTRPLAVSADGRSVAYVAVVDASNLAGDGTLFVLELATGEVSAPLGRDVVRAAFSPDGSMLAVQTYGMIRVVRLDGKVLREVPVSVETLLAGAQAWSPDAKFIATFHFERGYRFIAALSGEESPITIPAELLPNCWGDGVIGWRSPATVLISTGDVGGTTSNLITEVDLVGGGRRVLSRFEVGARDDLAVCDVQLAASLVPGMSIRPGTGPDRGSWPTWVITVALCAIMVACFLALWVSHRHRRKIIRIRSSSDHAAR